jgi:hypothetical protein
MLEPTVIHCPYCGEPIEILLDGSAGEQQYVEDCQVCCQPIVLSVWLDDDGEPSVRAVREDGA